MTLERGSDAERHDGGAVPRGGTHDGHDLIGGQGKHDGVGFARRMPRFAVAVMLDLCRVRRATVAELSMEIGCQRGARLSDSMEGMVEVLSVQCPVPVTGGANLGARRPAGKARRVRISGVCERGATQPAGMPRPGVMPPIAGTGH